jgi:hypothetical protein
MESSSNKRRNRAGLSTPSIKRFVLRAGVRRSHQLAMLSCELLLDRFLNRVLWRASVSAIHRKAKKGRSLEDKDVQGALRLSGINTALYKRKPKKAPTNNHQHRAARKAAKAEQEAAAI